MKIFLDAQGNVKIGDFGLAVQNVATSNFNKTMIKLEEDKDLTQGVGTPFYVSPEQIEKGKTYDKKVDMYSLGIIFFEMVFPMTSAMQRAKVLRKLREKVEFPVGFESKHNTEFQVIKMLLQHNAKERPTAEELLQSDLLPAQLDQEIMKEALRTIAIPNTTIFSLLMSKLFSFEQDKEVDTTFDFDSEFGYSHERYSILTYVMEKATKRLRLHGAVHVDPSFLIPKTENIQEKSLVLLLDQNGTVLTLPYDLTYPFARYVAQQNISHLKRFHFGLVFRKNHTSGQPKKLIELDFDIVGPTSYRNIHDAEVLRVAMEILSDFSAYFKPFYIKVLI